MDRTVIDTNVFVSAVIITLSIPRRAVGRTLDRGVLLFSTDTLRELAAVLFRPKFDRFVSVRDRRLFLEQLRLTAEMVPIVQQVRECRDPQDDKFLEVAMNGRADVIITGDADLLRMHPWRGISILSPSNYLK